MDFATGTLRQFVHETSQTEPSQLGVCQRSRAGWIPAQWDAELLSPREQLRVRDRDVEIAPPAHVERLPGRVLPPRGRAPPQDRHGVFVPGVRKTDAQSPAEGRELLG